jgi:catechol 2,3-dioxygenase-like lactoylglutathione lyase family enzyme
MPKLRRLTLVTLDPERLARFYEEVFEMRRVANPKGEAIYLTDGYFNLTLVPNRAEGKPNGLNHFGFDVGPEEAEAVMGRFAGWGLEAPKGREGKRSYANLRGTDPDGNNFDFSTRGFPTE